MLQVYHFGRAGKLPDASPFCVKLLTYLKMAGIEHECIRGSQHLNKSPQKKMPFIVHKGKTIGDSTLIINYLKQTFGDTLDDHLTAGQRRLGTLLQRTFEDHLYWVMVYSRWTDPEYFPITKQVFFAKLPIPLRFIVPTIARRRATKQVMSQGIGRHDRETIYQMGVADLELLGHYFGEQYLFGEKPSSFDAMAYGFLGNILYMAHQTPVKDYLDTQPKMIAYCDRIRDAFWQSK